MIRMNQEMKKKINSYLIPQKLDTCTYNRPLTITPFFDTIISRHSVVLRPQYLH